MSSLAIASTSQVATSTSKESDTISIKFLWKGPTSWHGGWTKGGLDVGVVDLLTKNEEIGMSVPIPKGTTSNDAQSLPFTIRAYHKTNWTIGNRTFKPLAKETSTGILHLTADEVRNLALKAGLFEESPNKGPAAIDSLGNVTYEKRVLRSDREIELEIPKELEAGASYHLTVTSDSSLSLTAKLEKGS